MPNIGLQVSGAGLTAVKAVRGLSQYNTPRYNLPVGWAYNATTKQFVRTETAWNILPGETGAVLTNTAYTTAVTLTDSGNRNTNSTALATEITNAYARAGHTIIYLAGGEWASDAGEISVPAPSGSNSGTTWVVIADARLKPSYGTAFPRATGIRVQSGDETNMPKFSVLLQPGTGGVRPWAAFTFAQGVRRFATVGIEFRYDPTFAPGGDNAGIPGLQEGFFKCYRGLANPNATAFADYVVVDRCVAHGRPSVAMTRAFYVDAHHVAYTNSRMYDIGSSQGDSQCIVATSGSGPYLIQNNYLGCGWGECVLFGGGDSGADAEVCADIVVQGNTLDFPPALKALGYNMKNLFEIKTGRRALICDNRFTNYIGDGAYGGQYYALVLKSVSQGAADKTGTVWWDLTYDVTVWNNKFIDCTALFSLASATQNNGNPDMHRIEIAHNFSPLNTNAFTSPRGWPVFVGGADSGITSYLTNELAAPRDLAVHHNTIFTTTGGYGFVQSAETINAGPMAPLWKHTIQDNICVLPTAASSQYFTANAAGSSAVNNWNDYTKYDTLWDRNAIVRGVDAQKIPNDLIYADPTAAGVNTDGTLTVTSPLLAASRDGGPTGANIAAINTAIARSATGL